MGSRPQTPTHDVLGPQHSTVDTRLPTRTLSTRSQRNSYLGSTAPAETDFAHSQGAPMESSPLGQTAAFNDGTELSYRDTSSITDGGTESGLRRSNSQMSQSQTLLPSRGGTLKKKASLKRSGSLKRSSSRRSSRAGSVRSLNLGEKEKYNPAEAEEINSAFFSPVPTSGSPTELLANRFQAWRKVLKDIITYFREVQKSYDVRSKSLLSASNLVNNTTIPSNFLTSGGLGEATRILKDFHRQALTESNKAKDMEQEVIVQLTGLRSDLQQKIKEIKSLSGDFKNSVDRELDGTKKAVNHLQEALGLVDNDASATSGKGDPFIVKLGVERQVEKQIEEENYLHRAYLNLESSGRELESIVVGEIQKAYNAYAGILKREADEAFETTERLREGPVAMPKDREWGEFVTGNDHMVDPRLPLRQWEQIDYPGRNHPAATEVRSGMLERKSKYLKNYTPGWYVLSPTHLHEFKSADGLASQAPVMSLYLPEQKLGSHSEPGSSSHKFMLKGRQTGSMHRGHSWIFRAESYDTMMQWFADIKELTEKTGEDRNAFVRRSHARSLSGNSFKAGSIGGSSDGAMEEDEADRMPYSGEDSIRGRSVAAVDASTAGGAAGAGAYAIDNEDNSSVRRRPNGGRFPSDIDVRRGLRAPLSPSSGESSQGEIAAAAALPGSGVGDYPDGTQANEAISNKRHVIPESTPEHLHGEHVLERTDSTSYGQWMGPTAASGALSTGAATASSRYVDGKSHDHVAMKPSRAPAQPASSAPIPVDASTDPESIVSARATDLNSSQGDTQSLSTVPTSLGSVGHGGKDQGISGSLEKEDRPSMKQHQSTTTISDLHIPGQYPKPGRA
ncbi:MAG: hypothetical protein Q9160_000782 [Pyrenula sp. 1 TL-2023]